MRSQAIEKLGMKICEAVQELPIATDVMFSPEMKRLDNLCAKYSILVDRENGDRAASVIREVMNNDI